MRPFVVVGVAAAVLLVPGGAGGSSRQVDAGAGISVVLPVGWRLVRQSVTYCSDPAQRAVFTTARGKLHPGYRVPAQAALVLLMEGTSGRFPARPARFRLPRRFVGTVGGCCEIPTGPGVELLFRDHGRRFYAFVLVGRRSGARRSAESLVNSLRIAPRR